MRKSGRSASSGWRESGLTADQFAAELGVNAGSLRFSGYKLNKAKRAAAGVVAAPRKKRAVAATAFVELRSVRRSSSWLVDKPALRELLAVREVLFRLYRTKGYRRAKEALTRLTDAMAHSSLPDVRTLRNTLMRWRREVLGYFVCRLTNARTEGYNGKAKLFLRRAYGFRSFSNYRLRPLSACA